MTISEAIKALLIPYCDAVFDAICAMENNPGTRTSLRAGKAVGQLRDAIDRAAALAALQRDTNALDNLATLTPPQNTHPDTRQPANQAVRPMGGVDTAKPEPLQPLRAG